MKKLFAVLLAVVLLFSTALAETYYILCQPDSFVNVRSFPKMTADVAGYVEIGERVETDGAKRNGFMHVTSPAFDAVDSWIYAGFLTDSPVTIETVDSWINSEKRVACRRAIGGKRRKWLLDGVEVVIYARSDSWAITNQGFIQTQFLGGF